MATPVIPSINESDLKSQLRMPPMRWVVFISGFLQSEARRSGIEDAWLRAQDFVHNESENKVALVYQTWCDNHRDLAERICRLSGQSARVAIVAYSWGVGYGAVRLSRHLKKCGIAVRRFVSCDGVYRPRTSLLSWIALTPLPIIKLPSNVKAKGLWWCRQQSKIPMGHDIELPNSISMPPPIIMKDHDHVHIDESIEFQEEAFAAVKDIAA